MAFTSVCSSGGDDEGAGDRMADMFGPGHVDQGIRQAIQMCWMSLPKERRTADEVERQIRRLVERAIQNFREDGEVFRRST